MKLDWQSILVTLAVFLYIAYKVYDLFEDDIYTIFKFIRKNGRRSKKKKGKQSKRLARIISESFNKKDDEEKNR